MSNSSRRNIGPCSFCASRIGFNCMTGAISSLWVSSRSGYARTSIKEYLVVTLCASLNRLNSSLLRCKVLSAPWRYAALIYSLSCYHSDGAVQTPCGPKYVALTVVSRTVVYCLRLSRCTRTSFHSIISFEHLHKCFLYRVMTIAFLW